MNGRINLPYSRQLIDDDDILAVCKVLQSDFLTTGPAIEEFERELAETVGAPYAVVCSSGTAALHLACMALDAGPSDSGIVPAITFVATANALRYCGAEVRFADVDVATGLSGVGEFKAALDRNSAPPPRFLLPVHLNGQCGDMEAVWNFAKLHNLHVIEDACHALGADYVDHMGQRHKVGACAHSDMAIFSFHPVKAIAAGEGGAITTKDLNLYRRLKVLRSHGLERNPPNSKIVECGSRLAADGDTPWFYEMQQPGYNYRMSDIHAALGASQLTKLDRFIGRRRAIATQYDSLLEPLAPLVRPTAAVPGCSNAYHLYAIRLDFSRLTMDRSSLMTRLHANGIGTQVHFLPVSEQPYYRTRYGPSDCPNAWHYYESTLSLPMHVGMADSDVEEVSSALADAILSARS